MVGEGEGNQLLVVRSDWGGRQLTTCNGRVFIIRLPISQQNKNSSQKKIEQCAVICLQCSVQKVINIEPKFFVHRFIGSYMYTFQHPGKVR